MFFFMLFTLEYYFPPLFFYTFASRLMFAIISLVKLPDSSIIRYITVLLGDHRRLGLLLLIHYFSKGLSCVCLSLLHYDLLKVEICVLHIFLFLVISMLPDRYVYNDYLLNKEMNECHL